MEQRKVLSPVFFYFPPMLFLRRCVVVLESHVSLADPWNILETDPFVRAFVKFEMEIDVILDKAPKRYHGGTELGCDPTVKLRSGITPGNRVVKSRCKNLVVK